MLDMAKKDIFPAVSLYSRELADTALAKKEFVPDCTYEEETLKSLSALASEAYRAMTRLEEVSSNAETKADAKEKADCYRDEVIPAMEALRSCVDELETITSADYWPYPSYGELLFGVR